MQTELVRHLNSNQPITLKEKLKVVYELSIPAILAQVSDIAMQYIDAAMVGSLGAIASASIGLVSSSTWLLAGIMFSCATGFAVQIAQAIGAKRYDESRNIFRQGIIVSLIFSITVALIGTLISPYIPIWLGANSDVIPGATIYFAVFCWFYPVRQIMALSQASLQCSGDMKTPSILNGLMCLLDVIFNFFLIFPSRQITIFNMQFHVYGANLGVYGAALGTAFAIVACAILTLYFACIKSPILHLTEKGSWKLQPYVLHEARRISFSMALERVALSGAQILSTRIISPLGTVAIAAHSFAITAESICYMPGYGIGSASTTLVGQSIGAKRHDMAVSFAWLTTLLGMAIMGLAGVFMYFYCPYVISFFTSDVQTAQLAAQVLRIELFAEPMFAASIVVSSALRGAKDTFVPALLNLVSMWGVRLTLAYILSKSFGLSGVWIAMCIELNVRGILFLIRLKSKTWLKRA